MNPTPFCYDFTASKDRLNFVRHFWMCQDPLAQTFARTISGRMADLLDVFGAVYAADRQAKRSFKDIATGQRDISIRIPVTEPERWNCSELVTLLRKLLAWVSGDAWSFEFTGRPISPADSPQGFLFDMPLTSPVTVSLFSGGLDSLAGLARHAQDSPGGSRILVSGYTAQPTGVPTGCSGEAYQGG